MEPPETPEKSPRKLVRTVVVALGLAGAAIGVPWLMEHTNPGLARLEVTRGGSAQTFVVEEAGTLQVWADIDISHEGIGTGSPNSSLPHVVDWVVSLEREGAEPVTRRCNPFDSNYARVSGSTSPMGEPSTRSYDGLIRGCAFPVTPGTYTVRVNEAPNAPDPRIRFRRRVMHLRTSGW